MIPEWLRQPKARVYTTHRSKIPTVKIDNLNNFVSYEEAKLLIQKDPTLGLGIGMWGYLCGIDIDHCIEDNHILPEAQAIINLFPEAYIEKSFSGTGLHFLFLSQEQYPNRKDSYYIKLGKKHMKEQSLPFHGLEFYQGLQDHRYLTLTEDVIQSPTHRTDVSGEKIQQFLDTYFKRPPAPTNSITVSSTDEEDMAWWCWAKKRRPERLFQLASQLPTGSGGTESEDDLSFMIELAFWTNKNPHLMCQAFESSYYYKHKDAKHIRKWTTHPSYRRTTIEKACATGSVAKEYFKDTHQYDPTTKTIINIEERSGDMIAPKHSTRISQRGETVHILETKRYKFEVSNPKPKKDSQERYVQWVSVYEKGSDNPSTFLDRKDPAFELAAGIILDKGGE